MESRTRCVAHTIAMIVLIIYCIGCGGKSPNTQSTQYVLVAGIHPSPGWIAIFDCASDSLIDSLGYDGQSGLSFVWGSPSGDFLAVGEASRPARIWDLRSKSQVANIALLRWAVFVPTAEKLLTFDGQYTRIYGMPNFEEDTTLDLSLIMPTRLPRTSLLLAIRPEGPRTAPQEMTEIVVIDCENRNIVDSFRLYGQESSQPMSVRYLEAAREGAEFYALVEDPSAGAVAMRIDLETHEVVFRVPITAATGVCRLDPEGRELWVTDPGILPILGEPIWPGQVLVLDSKTGAVLDTIPTVGLDPSSGISWQVNDIQFVPGLRKVYVNCRPYFGQSRPLLVIDTETKAVTDLLLVDTKYSAFSISVVPQY